MAIESNMPVGMYFSDDGMCIAVRRSDFTGKLHLIRIKLTENQWKAYCSGYGMIQDVLSHLDADEREFLMTGITPSEWADNFGKE